MTTPTSSPRHLFVLSTLAAALCSSCGGEPSLLVHLPAWPDGAEQLRATPYVDGVARDSFIVSKGSPGFLVSFPEGHSGELRVAVTGLDADACEMARGEVADSIGPGLRLVKEATLDLSPIATAQCAVTVTAAGAELISSKANIACQTSDDSTGTCQGLVDKGTSIALSLKDAASRWANWGEFCLQGTTCSFQITRALTAQVTVGNSCSAGRWCRTSPMPDAERLFALDGSGPEDLWAVGALGVTAHWDGHVWHNLPPIVDTSLNGVWAGAPQDAWSVGSQGVALHWDGVRWQRVGTGVSGDLQGVWGAAVDDVWAVGAQGLTLHWNGAQWTQSPSGTTVTLYAVWGRSAQDIWAVGDQGVALHFDGNGWSPVRTKTTQPLRSIAGSEDGILATGASGTLIQLSASTATQVATYTTQTLYGISAPSSGSQTYWTVGSNDTLGGWNGSGWSATSLQALYAPPTDRFAIWSGAASQRWIAGDYGDLTMLDGDGKLHPTNAAHFGYGTICGFSADDYWVMADQTSEASSSGALLHWMRDHWVSIDAPIKLRSIWCHSPSDIWALGARNDVMRWNGSTWVDMNFPFGAAYWQLWGYDSGSHVEVWLVGESGNVAHWDGAYWSNQILSTPKGMLHPWNASIYGFSNKSIWIAGQDTFYFNGSSWIHQDQPPALDSLNVQALWGMAANDIWASGSGGHIMHWDGKVWTEIVAPDPAMPEYYGLNALWGSSNRDIWAAGYRGAMLHYDGAKWSKMDSGTQNSVVSLWGTAAGNMVATAYGGTIFHYRQ